MGLSAENSQETHSTKAMGTTNGTGWFGLAWYGMVFGGSVTVFFFLRQEK